MKIHLVLGMLLILSLHVNAQEYFPENTKVKASKNTNYTAFKNAKIHVNPSETIENGTLVIRNGRVTEVGKNVKVPKNAVEVDLKGKEIYPSFIELYSDFGIKKPKKAQGEAHYDASRKGYYWNDHIRPETRALDHYSYSSSDAEKLKKLGFGAVNTHVPDGIIRGTGMLITLNSDKGDGERILSKESSQYFSFDKSVQSKQMYPTSIMGSMALLRQVYFDAEWYAQGNTSNTDLSLEAFNRQKTLTQIFKADNLINELNAVKLAKENNQSYVIYGSGLEFQNIRDIKASEATYILPLDFPKDPDVEDVYLSDFISLEDLRIWNQAPSNPAILEESKVKFAISAFSAKDKFKENLIKAIERGLSKETALAALTTIPAEILGKQDELGSLKKGAHANFLITSGDLFDKESVLYENWVQGERMIIEDKDLPDVRGDYVLQLNDETYSLKITGEKPTNPKGEISLKSQKLGSKLSYKDHWLTIVMASADSTKNEFARLVAKIPANTKEFKGKAILPDGTESVFTAEQKGDFKEKSKDAEKFKEEEVLALSFPNKAYGYTSLPQPEEILFKGATVWTNEKEGILENSDVLVKNGKISAVGMNLKPGKAKVVDAQRMHLTSGIIDEHSHIAAIGINESGHNTTAEVDMADAFNPNDIQIYRNLAGGVTTINLLHGSANAIGGKAAVFKPKWGRSKEEMLLDDVKYIKFALGENVKQSNWGSGERFPQTRMGVEQQLIDYFTRAKAYKQQKESGKPYRKDLEMETLVEILDGKRHITAHSYVASEILMLLSVAERCGFKVNTFTHILEGYKVADRLKEHGAGGATFSDWWAYKYEVNDAIPQNAAIMHKAGVTVAINSDDAEMSRHLNQEAAKSVKYGGISEEEAWKFITLNPAKLLRIDDKVGSIKAGKDADLVLWTGNPLSVYSKPVKTMIEGVVYFDEEMDQEHRKQIKAQKSQLINQLLKSKNKKLTTSTASKKSK